MVIYHLNQENFEIEIGQKPAVVDFWAKWCNPCNMMEKPFEELSEKYDDRIKFVKIDFDKSNLLAEIHEVTSLPSFLFFNKGKVMNRLIGGVGKEVLEKSIKQFLEHIKK